MSALAPPPSPPQSSRGEEGGRKRLGRSQRRASAQAVLDGGPPRRGSRKEAPTIRIHSPPCRSQTRTLDSLPTRGQTQTIDLPSRSQTLDVASTSDGGASPTASMKSKSSTLTTGPRRGSVGKRKKNPQSSNASSAEEAAASVVLSSNVVRRTVFGDARHILSLRRTMQGVGEGDGEEEGPAMSAHALLQVVLRSVRLQHHKSMFVAVLSERAKEARELRKSRVPAFASEQSRPANQEDEDAFSQASSQASESRKEETSANLNLENMQQQLGESLDCLFDTKADDAYQNMNEIQSSIAKCVELLKDIRNRTFQQLDLCRDAEAAFAKADGQAVSTNSISARLNMDIERMQNALQEQDKQEDQQAAAGELLSPEARASRQNKRLHSRRMQGVLEKMKEEVHCLAAEASESDDGDADVMQAELDVSAEVQEEEVAEEGQRTGKGQKRPGSRQSTCGSCLTDCTEETGPQSMSDWLSGIFDVREASDVETEAGEGEKEVVEAEHSQAQLLSELQVGEEEEEPEDEIAGSAPTPTTTKVRGQALYCSEGSGSSTTARSAKEEAKLKLPNIPQGAKKSPNTGAVFGRMEELTPEEVALLNSLLDGEAEKITAQQGQGEPSRARAPAVAPASIGSWVRRTPVLKGLGWHPSTHSGDDVEHEHSMRLAQLCPVAPTHGGTHVVSLVTTTTTTTTTARHRAERPERPSLGPAAFEEPSDGRRRSPLSGMEGWGSHSLSLSPPAGPRPEPRRSPPNHRRVSAGPEQKANTDFSFSGRASTPTKTKEALLFAQRPMSPPGLVLCPPSTPPPPPRAGSALGFRRHLRIGC